MVLMMLSTVRREMTDLGCCVFQCGVYFSPQAGPELRFLKVEQ